MEGDSELVDLSSEFFNEGLLLGGFGGLRVLIGSVGIVLELDLWDEKKDTIWADCISFSYFYKLYNFISCFSLSTTLSKLALLNS